MYPQPISRMNRLRISKKRSSCKSTQFAGIKPFSKEYVLTLFLQDNLWISTGSNMHFYSSTVENSLAHDLCDLHAAVHFRKGFHMCI